jgi:hypothetical protein
MFKKILALAAVVTMAWAGPAIAQSVDIDPDAGGSAVPILVDGLDWNVGNSIALGFSVSNPLTAPTVPINQPFQVYYQANLNSFNLDGSSNTFDNNAGSGNDSWTLVLGFGEQATGAASLTPGTLSIGFGFAPDQSNFDNFFQIYANTDEASDLSGFCFVCGEVIMEGHFIADGFVSTFTIDDLNSDVPLDQAPAGDDDYSGVETITGAGVVNLTAVVDSYSLDYFINPLQLITFALAPSTGTAMPFTTVDPSACFYDEDGTTEGCQGSFNYTGGTGGSVSSFVGVGSVGADNGWVEGDSPNNTMFQSDASSTFIVQAVPEPASLTLFGLGAAGLAAARRRQQRKNAKK